MTLSRRFLILIAVAGIAVVFDSTRAELAYRQTFNNELELRHPSRRYRFQLHTGNDAVDGSDSILASPGYVAEFTGSDLIDKATNINAVTPSGDGTTNDGRLFSLLNPEPTFWSTNLPFTIPSENLGIGAEILIDMDNSDVDAAVHAAIRFGTTWYVTGRASGSLERGWFNEFFSLNQTWRELNFVPGESLEVVGEALAFPRVIDDVTGLGIYVPATTDSLRFDNLAFDVSQSVEAPLYGDFNGDSQVTIADYLDHLQPNMLTGGLELTGVEAYALGDMDGDLFTTPTDFLYFKQRFDELRGPGAFAQALATVPEPSAFVLLISGFAWWTHRRRRRRQPAKKMLLVAFGCLLPFGFSIQPTDAQETVYLQAFPNDPDFDGPPATRPLKPSFGIRTYFGPTALDSSSTANTPYVRYQATSSAGMVDNINAPEPNGDGASVDRGYLQISGSAPSTNRLIVADLPFTIERGSADDLAIGVWMNNSEPDTVFPAIELGVDNWLVAEASFRDDFAEWFDHSLDVTPESLWRQLVFEADVQQSLTDASVPFSSFEGDITGFGFYMDAKNGNVRLDQFSLSGDGLVTTDPPERALTLVVGGAAATIVNMINGTTIGPAVDIDLYTIRSPAGEFNPAEFRGLEAQNIEGSGPPGDGLGWEELGASETEVSEGLLAGSYRFAHGEAVGLYNLNIPGSDLEFSYHRSAAAVDDIDIGNVVYAIAGDTDLDGDVDSADGTRLIGNWTGALPAGVGTKTLLDGDADGDGDVDAADRTRLVVNWSGALEAASFASEVVPEPRQNLPLIVAWLVASIVFRASRRRR